MTIMSMKVIFIQEVDGVARRNDVREVADGYALNYLLPHGLAVRAKTERLQALSQQQRTQAQAQAREAERSRSLAGELKGKTVTLTRPASSTGTLYAAVSAETVAQAVADQLKVRLQPYQIVVPPHVKTVGNHQAQIKLTADVNVTFNLQIKPA